MKSPLFLLSLGILLLGFAPKLHCVVEVQNLKPIEKQIYKSILNQVQQIPRKNQYEENIIGSFTVLRVLPQIGYQVAFNVINRGEFQAFFDPSGEWISLNRVFDAYYTERKKTLVIQTLKTSHPRLLIYHQGQLHKTIPLPLLLQQQNIRHMVQYPQFGDNYGFSKQLINKFSEINKHLVPIYYQPDRDLKNIRVLVFNLKKETLINYDQPISEVIPLKKGRFLVYHRILDEGKIEIPYFYVLNHDLEITNELSEINQFLNQNKDGFLGFKYYENNQVIKLHFLNQANQEKTFDVE